MSYNGHANYETWLVNVWDYLPMFEETAQELGPDKEYELADIMKEYLEEEKDNLLEGMEASMWCDLLGAAFQQIDFDELAELVYSNVEFDEE